jgi:hypothetical protein
MPVKGEMPFRRVLLQHGAGVIHQFLRANINLRNAPVKYSLRMFTGPGREGAKTPGRLALRVDRIVPGDGPSLISGQFDPEWSTFDAELSKNQFALIRSAQKAIIAAPITAICCCRVGGGAH